MEVISKIYASKDVIFGSVCYKRPVDVQITYIDNFGLTCQSKPAIINREYIIDYISAYARDLVVYEDGSYVTNFTYGLDRISQTVTHIPGKTAAGFEGQNAYTDLAVEMYGKLYFHQDRIGSTIRMTKESGQTIAWANYDEWGVVRSPLEHDMNMAGVDNAIGFTTYTYDIVLDVYFAQARMYDPSNRRFMAVDPVEDGTNWYVYCGNSPAVFVDPLGLVADSALQDIYQMYHLAGGNNNPVATKWLAETLYATANPLMPAHQIAQVVIADAITAINPIAKPKIEYSVKTQQGTTAQIDVLHTFNGTATILEVKSLYDIKTNGEGAARRKIASYCNDLTSAKNTERLADDNIKNVTVPNTFFPVTVKTIPNIVMIDNDYIKLSMAVHDLTGGLYAYEIVLKNKRKNEQVSISAPAAYAYAQRELSGYYAAMYEIETHIYKTISLQAKVMTIGLCLQTATLIGATASSLPAVSAYIEGLTEAQSKAVVLEIVKEVVKEIPTALPPAA